MSKNGMLQEAGVCYRHVGKDETIHSSEGKVFSYDRAHVRTSQTDLNRVVVQGGYAAFRNLLGFWNCREDWKYIERANEEPFKPALTFYVMHLDRVQIEKRFKSLQCVSVGATVRIMRPQIILDTSDNNSVWDGCKHWTPGKEFLSGMVGTVVSLGTGYAGVVLARVKLPHIANVNGELIEEMRFFAGWLNVIKRGEDPKPVEDERTLGQCLLDDLKAREKVHRQLPAPKVEEEPIQHLAGGDQARQEDIKRLLSERAQFRLRIASIDAQMLAKGLGRYLEEAKEREKMA